MYEYGEAVISLIFVSYTLTMEKLPTLRYPDRVLSCCISRVDGLVYDFLRCLPCILRLKSY